MSGPAISKAPCQPCMQETVGRKCRSMASVQRPRVAALGLIEQEVAVLRRYEGTIHEAPTLWEYLNGENARSFAETDIIVGRLVPDGTYFTEIPSYVHLLMIEGTEFYFPGSPSRQEKLVHDVASTMYEWTPRTENGHYGIAIDQLERPSIDPLRCWIVDDLVVDNHQSLAAASDGNSVAIRYIRRTKPRPSQKHADGMTVVVTKVDEPARDHGIGVGIPTGGILEHWYPAFLRDVHERNNKSVPIAPAANPVNFDWATVDERKMIAETAETEAKIDSLTEEVDRLRVELDKLWARENSGARACLFVDGEPLVDAVTNIFEAFDFAVRNLDDSVPEGEMKGGDLELASIELNPTAFVEVTGSKAGIATSKSRQIIEHLGKYIADYGRQPSSVLWVVTHHRSVPLADRPAIKKSESDQAEGIGAILVDTRDLYQCWQQVIRGEITKDQARLSLASADPGLWSPPSPA